MTPTEKKEELYESQFPFNRIHPVAFREYRPVI